MDSERESDAHYEPTPILIDGSYQLVNAGIFIFVVIIVLVASQQVFQRRDVRPLYCSVALLSPPELVADHS